MLEILPKLSATDRAELEECLADPGLSAETIAEELTRAGHVIHASSIRTWRRRLPEK